MHETHTENKMATDHLAPTNPGDHRSEQNEWWDQTPKMELDRAYIEEEQRGALCYSIGVEARGEETRSTKNNMEENGWRRKTSSWVAIMDDCQTFSSKPKWMERECQSLMCLMARRDIERNIILAVYYCSITFQVAYSNKLQKEKHSKETTQDIKPLN